MGGVFITFEGTEGSGKSTQVKLLADRLKGSGREVVLLREPGGTPLGEELRNVVKHSPSGKGMCPEAEILLMSASRAQLVREVIRPALERGAIVLCDRFYDSTIAYQGFGRGIDLSFVERVIDFTVEETRPNLTLLLRVPTEISEQRRQTRQQAEPALNDRFEESDRAFFDRVEEGFNTIGRSGDRVRVIEATQSIEVVQAEVWRWVEQLLDVPDTQGDRAYKTIGEYRNEAPA